MMNSSVTSRRQLFQSLGAAALAAPALAAPRSKALAPAERARLDSNESAYGPFPSAIRAMAKAVERGNYYVGPELIPVQQKLAALHGVAVENLLFGAGSTEPLRAVTQVLCSAHHPVIVGEPTFEDVAETAEASHSRVIKIPVTGRGLLDVERMVAAAREHSAGLLYLCNPNNPTSTITGKDKLAWLVDNLPSGTILLADEAYSDLVDDPAYQSAAPYVKQDRNVIVLRTFSKLYGLAGMRLGYAVAPKRLLDKIRPAVMDGSINQAVVAAARASLDDRATYDLIKTENARVRRYTMESMRQMGLQCFESQTNFVMVDLKRPIQPVKEKLAQRGFLVARLFPALPTYQRITLGTMAEMQRFLPAFKEAMQG